MPQPKEHWSAGDLYEPYVGRWSRKVALEFLAWLQVPPNSQWLDVGCGTGALTQAVLRVAQPASVLGIDASPAFIDFAQAFTPEGRARYEVGDAQALTLAAQSVDVVVSGLMLNFVPQPELALAEMVRVARPGGQVAVYVWDYAQGMQLMRRFWDAAVQLNPAALDSAEGRRFPMCRPDPLRALFEQAGLQAVEVKALEVPTVFRDFDDYWSPFLGGQGPAPGYAMALPEAERLRLRELIRAALPVAPDGSIPLSARAWGVRGRTPASLA
ncbi:class I SAM-dependent methyltransferase [Variovorax sp. OV329]|uniref:class I SAM-dependent methyltransferase n=1 Tax=Variovorax sp. OV329 TaxID=1882825 RepID=UPI0008EEBC2B|nr:class I SAM-dependent methyltransferase [Variovorax sp. OV329]SFM74166.1 Ubiquinone/menaquinone biosynthesis C-methylase UbiE [Variovorax sp. OV329]